MKMFTKFFSSLALVRTTN